MKTSKARTVLSGLLLIVYLLLLLTNLIPEKSIDTTVKLFLTLAITELLVFALPTLFYSKLRGKELTDRLPIALFAGKSIPFLLATAAVILTFGLFFNSLFFFLGIGKESYTALGSYILSSISLSVDPLYAIIAYAAIPAVTEELLFRGILLTEYRDRSFLTAATVSAFSFAFCYFDLSAFPFYFVSGLLLAYAVRMTNSLWSAVAIRFVVALSSIYLMPTLWQVVTQPLGVLFALFVSATLFLISLFFFFKALSTRYAAMARDPRSAGDTPYPSKLAWKNTGKALIAPLFLVSFGIFLAASIIFVFV